MIEARYEIEPSERIPGCLWVASYGDGGVRLCTPVSYKSADWAAWAKETYERFDALEGVERRGLLEALKYAPAIVEAMDEELRDYARGLCCAGQLARKAHEIKKDFVRVFGMVPDTTKRDALAAFDDKGPGERRAYMDETAPGWEKAHVSQREPIERWIAGEIDGKALWGEQLVAQAGYASVANAFPG